MNFGGAVHINRLGAGVFFTCLLFTAFYMLSVGEDYESSDVATINVKKVLFAAIELAEKGGEQVVNIRKKADLLVQSKGKTKEGANNPVTEADYNSHCVMYFGLKKTFPKLKIISEEVMSEEKCGYLSSPILDTKPTLESKLDHILDKELPVKDLTAWIDPLDATQEFTENLLQYVTTLVCLAYKGHPIIGVIHRPFGEHPQTTWAWIQNGMSSDLLSYKHMVDSEAGVIVSRSHTGVVENVVKRALGQDTKITRAGGAGYKVMQVVNGNASAYVHITAIKKWDICAGDAVITAWGGRMTTLTGENIDYRSTAQKTNTDGLLVTSNNHRIYQEKFHRALQRDLHL